MKKEFNKLRILVVAMLLTGSVQLSAQQAPEQIDDIIEQMEQLFQEFSQGSFMQMDSLMMQDFNFPAQMDSIDFGFGNMPGIMLMDTLMIGPNGFSDDIEMDLQGLMDELSKSFDTLDPSYLQEMEQMIEQLRSNGILPEEGFELPKQQPKKKNKVYKI